MRVEKLDPVLTFPRFDAQTLRHVSTEEPFTHRLDGEGIFTLVADTEWDGIVVNPWDDTEAGTFVSKQSFPTNPRGEAPKLSKGWVPLYSENRHIYHSVNKAGLVAHYRGAHMATLKQARAYADFDLARWQTYLDNEWAYLGVRVGVRVGDYDLIARDQCACWGVESDSLVYIGDVANENAREAERQLKQTIAGIYVVVFDDTPEMRVLIVESRHPHRSGDRFALFVQEQYQGNWSIDTGWEHDPPSTAPDMFRAAAGAAALHREHVRYLERHRDTLRALAPSA